MDVHNNSIVRIGNSLRKLNQAFYQATRKDSEACGITPIQFLALRILKQYPGISLSELSEFMHTGLSTTSGVVERLVQADLVRRERLQTDRRSVVLRLSPTGEELVLRTNQRIMQRLSPLLQLPEEDVEHLLCIHERIIHILQKAGEEP